MSPEALFSIVPTYVLVFFRIVAIDQALLFWCFLGSLRILEFRTQPAD